MSDRCRAWLGVVPLLAFVGTGCPAQAPAGWGEAWTAADALFHRDARFLGADGAYSVDLGGGRVLWLFGDSGVGGDPRDPESGSYFLRNTVALQTGLDPSTAFLRYYWGRDGHEPRSFLAEPDDAHWFWPAHGARLGSALLLFYERLRNEGVPGPNSFRGAGWAAVIVDNPDDDPDAWSPRFAQIPDDDLGVSLGEAVVVDGEDVYVYGTRGDPHAVVLARFGAAAAAAGDLTAPAWYADGEFDAGRRPASLIDIGAPEFSVHLDAALGRYLFVSSTGYGATGVGWRAAPRPEGPWTEVRDVYRPPESYGETAFVYAAKAHPEQAGGGLVATYVPSSFDAIPPELSDRYYWPHFVRLYLE
jgi:hypothetical protein